MAFDEFRAMNTTVQVAALDDRGNLAPAFRQIRQLIAEYEARFSRFRDESELNQLNRSAGTWFRASAALFALVQEAVALHQKTDGLFDPTILRALQNAGYDRSMDVIRKSGPLPAPIWHQSDTSHLDGVRLDTAGKGICLPADVQIDLGGIAKGWIAEKAVQRLAEFSPVCAVSAGGDMAFHGVPTGQAGWQVSLEDPRDEENVLAVLQVQPGGLATSSVTKRRWMQGGQERHHIIDPRTGEPADVEWLSVSVGAPSITTAEAFAKAILIGGSALGSQIANRIPGLWFIAVLPDGSLLGNKKSKEVVYEPV